MNLRSRPAVAAWRGRPSPAIAAELQAAFGNRAVTSSAVREQHGHTLTWIANQPPDVVVYPETTEEVAEIVTLCAAHGVPVDRRSAPAPRSRAMSTRRSAASRSTPAG